MAANGGTLGYCNTAGTNCRTLKEKRIIIVLMANVLQLRGVSKTYGATRVLDDVSLRVEQGEIFGFLGPNGAGKSTTLRCIMDFIRPDKGEIQLWGQDSRKDGPSLRARLGYVPAEPNLHQNWTVGEHLWFVHAVQPVDIELAHHLLSKLELDETKRVKHLSTGNQQKLALILGLITKPDLLLLDEPTRGLDPLLRTTLHGLLREFQAGGGTVLLSSHDLAEVEQLCTNAAIIRKGRIVDDTTVAALKQAGVYHVNLTFAGTKQLPSPAVLKPLDVRVAGRNLQFRVKGLPGPLLQWLACHEPSDVQVTTGNLEDAFAEIYT